MTEEEIREIVRYWRLESGFREMTDEEFELTFADIDPFAQHMKIFKDEIRRCRD